jgi:hypothetical protein
MGLPLIARRSGEPVDYLDGGAGLLAEGFVVAAG